MRKILFIFAAIIMKNYDPSFFSRAHVDADIKHM